MVGSGKRIRIWIATQRSVRRRLKGLHLKYILYNVRYIDIKQIKQIFDSPRSHRQETARKAVFPAIYSINVQSPLYSRVPRRRRRRRWWPPGSQGLCPLGSAPPPTAPSPVRGLKHINTFSMSIIVQVVF